MTQRDEGHDYRDSKNKAMEYARRKKKKEEKEIRHKVFSPLEASHRTKQKKEKEKN